MVKKFAWYPADDEHKHFKRSKPKATKLRKGIQPGSVLVLLSGRFRGKRVVFLKQLTSGLLLVTGPYKINGVPLKRVNQAYTLTTSTKVNVNGVDVSKIDDALFKREKKAKRSQEEKFFAESAKVSHNISQFSD
jgi:large subunit ribosomal protein L6e